MSCRAHPPCAGAERAATPVIAAGVSLAGSMLTDGNCASGSARPSSACAFGNVTFEVDADRVAGREHQLDCGDVPRSVGNATLAPSVSSPSTPELDAAYSSSPNGK